MIITKPFTTRANYIKPTIDINKNIEYVLGADQKDESRNKETINEEETID